MAVEVAEGSLTVLVALAASLVAFQSTSSQPWNHSWLSLWAPSTESLVWMTFLLMRTPKSSLLVMGQPQLNRCVLPGL